MTSHDEQRMKAMHAYVAGLIKDGVTVGKIIEKLAEFGIDAETAQQAIFSVGKKALEPGEVKTGERLKLPAKRKKQGRRLMTLAGVLIGLAFISSALVTAAAANREFALLNVAVFVRGFLLSVGVLVGFIGLYVWANAD